MVRLTIRLSRHNDLMSNLKMLTTRAKAKSTIARIPKACKTLPKKALTLL